MKKTHNIIISISSLLLINFSCTKKCPDNVELNNFYLSEKSKKIFPYQNGQKELIFRDSIGNVLTFELDTSNKIFLSEKNWNEDCTLKDSTNKEIEVKAGIEWQTISLKPDSLINLSFNIFLKQEVEIDASNLEDIKEFDGINIYRANVSQMAIITDTKNSIFNKLPSEKVESITINGKTLNNVLKSRYTNSGDIYYDIEKGIVAINENQGGFEKEKFWVLDSIVFKK
ncbi:hypothetical protein [Aquimarina algicola]|uniref:Uncharacterized protein n=1 Tax=Aquimarina algicola TaxID=2589995 RepID=A0A504J2Z5_9FLAO|nr:hypothetical protein [Aquimarina algicola]TPN82792.1 hypothetical protein FHK87_20405 [Aquimarina algicola]